MSRQVCTLWCVWLTLMLSTVHPSLVLAQDPNSDKIELKSLLATMVKTMRETNYRGRLTYEHSGKLEVLEIAHGVADGVEYQSVFYLNGPDRALLKNGRHSDCATQGSRLLSGGVINMASQAVAMENTYTITLLGLERVAGRDSWVVQLAPKDEYRHSFILAIDQASYLPTKALFVARGSKVLERLHFVALETGVAFDESSFKGPAKLNHLSASSTCNDGEPIEQGSQWQPAWLPPGFVMSGYQFSAEDGHMETYTDGLATFSVFTKPLAVQAGMAAKVLPSFKKGATVLVMRLMEDKQTPVQVSVLGEIPGDTADRILSSVTSFK